MAYTQAQLEALDEAIASGAQEVWYEHKKVEYRSLSDMLRLREIMANDIANAGQPKRRRRVARYSNGL